MTPMQVSQATGICLGTVYRHLKNGRLHGHFSADRWSIPVVEVYSWAFDCWDSGRYRMFPLDWMEKFISEFCY